MIYTALDNFYLSDEELANSPSRKDNIDEETETTLRIFGCELIQEAGILLKCPQAVMATGQVLFQRFFCRKSMRDYNVRRMACACLFLATKLEESHKRTRDILMVFDRINKRREGSKSLPLLMPETNEYNSMKERVITYERILLKTFGFIIHAVHPHKFVNSFVHSLEGSDELQQLAWNFLNDSLRTTLCVRFKGHVVAAGAIYLAARRLEVPLPDSPPWWEAFKVPTEQLVEVVLALHNLYQRPKAHYIEVNPEILKHQAASGLGTVKQQTPGLEGNDSPAVQDSSLIRGGPDLGSQQVGGPPTTGQVATTTAGPIATSTAGPAGGAAEMLAAAVAAAQQRLQGNALVAGVAGAAAVAAAAQLDQGGNGLTTTAGGQGNGAAAAASGGDGAAIESRKRSRSRERSDGSKQPGERTPSRSASRSRSRSRDRGQGRGRSRSPGRDKHRELQKDSSRRDHRSRSRSHSRDRRDRYRERRDRDRDRERERERERERDRRERDSRGDRPRERDRERDRGRDYRQPDRDVRGSGFRDDGRDRKESGLPPPPPLPPRHPDRRR